MSEKKNIESLFQRYLKNECTPAEIKELLQYFDSPENELLLRRLIKQQSEANEDVNFVADSNSLLDAAFSNIQKTIAANNVKNTQIIPFYKHFLFRAVAAAVLIFLIAAQAFYFLLPKSRRAVAKTENVHKVKDILPGRNNAVLTLDNGKTITLDSAGNGLLAKQGNMMVLKINGQIAYKAATGVIGAKPVYNTITTAKGNDYQLVLSDGSKVWLNAASSIHFPSYFSGEERKVEITGEAYFEVSHDRSKPFKVEFNNAAGEKSEVEVLGTHFDVNAYPDEENIKATLLQGSVKIRRGNKTQLLSPGEQAILTSDAITLKKNIDVSQVVAWKDGYFLFANADIRSIMLQVARWYDVQVTFEGKIPADGFTGKISRNVPLSKFLKVLELNDVHVKTEGRMVTIIQ